MLVGGYCLLIVAMLITPPAANVSYAQKKKEPPKKSSQAASKEEADRQFAERMAAGGEQPAGNVQGGVPGQPAASTGAGTGKPLDMLELWKQGGWVMVPISAMSFIVVLFACERFLALRRGRVIPPPAGPRVGRTDRASGRPRSPASFSALQTIPFNRLECVERRVAESRPATS